MATATTTWDVFLSHSFADNEVVNDIVDALEHAGLETFHYGELTPGQDMSSAIWDALAESRALIAVVTPDTPLNATGMVEIGAATAWNKPVYVVVNGSSSTQLPTPLKQYQAFPRNRINEIVGKIRHDFEPLSDDEKDALAGCYQELGVSADQLSQSPSDLRELVTKFHHKTHKHLSGERLLSELFRLRKKSKLPRLKK